MRTGQGWPALARRTCRSVQGLIVNAWTPSLGAAVLARQRQTRRQVALRSIRRSRDSLPRTTTIECCGDRCLRHPASSLHGTRTARFLTAVARPTTSVPSTRLRGPRRSKTEPGRQAWRFIPLQRIPHPGRSPGTNPDPKQTSSSCCGAAEMLRAPARGWGDADAPETHLAARCRSCRRSPLGGVALAAREAGTVATIGAGECARWAS